MNDLKNTHLTDEELDLIVGGAITLEQEMFMTSVHQSNVKSQKQKIYTKLWGMLDSKIIQKLVGAGPYPSPRIKR